MVMDAQMQFTDFTHGKCQQCGYLALIDKFESLKENCVKQEGNDGFSCEMYQLILKCPICGDTFCEALFPNEIN